MNFSIQTLLSVNTKAADPKISGFCLVGLQGFEPGTDRL